MSEDEQSQANRAVYEQASVVAYYRDRDDLLPGETAAFRVMADDLPQARLLDLGCGGGRTSVHLLPLVRDYVGLDFSPEMVEACRKRFQGSPGRFRFLDGDARDLSTFADASFDVVLFSFNGLDTLGHEDRLRTLREIRRVLTRRGWFCFSTHLLPSLRPRFIPATERRGAPWHGSRRVRELFRFYNRNLADFENHNWAVVRDAAHSFSLLTYYANPDTIIRQLFDGDFSCTRFFAGYEDREFAGAELAETPDNWVYVLARAGDNTNEENDS